MELFDLAKMLAEKSDNTKARLGAVLIRKNEILARSPNYARKSHPLQQQYNRFREGKHTRHALHAEIGALAKVGYTDLEKLKDATVYISRIRLDGSYGLARPCPACMNALFDFGVRKAYYTTDKGFAKEVIVRV
jgi:deoxycytidylate deaminase